MASDAAPPTMDFAAFRGRDAPIITMIFVMSGAAGLMYQTVWSRQLVLVFGNTSQATSTIVAAFMVGLGFGGLAGAAAARRAHHPLRVYGLVELAVGALAMLVPLGFGRAASAYGMAYTSSPPVTLALVRFALAVLVISPVTFLMGTTLPLLTAHLVREVREAGPALGRLYAANTLGATGGTLVAGFLLIEFLGLSGTSFVAVGMNLVAGALALVLARGTARVAAAPTTPPLSETRGDEEAGAGASPPPPPMLIYGATFLSGFAALALEILWTRSIAEGSGSYIYVFFAVLALYLIGTTVGSRRYEFRSRVRQHTTSTLAGILAATGALALASVFVGSRSEWDLIPALRSLGVMMCILGASALMGFGFPLMARLLTRNAAGAGPAVGRMYAINTVGAILGSFAGTFALAGTIGTPRSILVLGLALLAGAAVLSLVATRSAPLEMGRAVGYIALGLAVVGLVAWRPSLGRTSTENFLRRVPYPSQHAEDDIATVDSTGGPQTEMNLFVSGVSMTKLTADTKLMGYLPTVLRPAASRFLVVAFGMGGTYRASLINGARTDAIDLSPSVPRQMHMFFPDAPRFLADPRGRVIVADGRNYVQLATARYDSIAVDPPPPVSAAGAVVLYTREFFEQAKRRLNPGGVMMLWIPYSVDLADYRMHVRTFRASFRHVTVVLSPGRKGSYLYGSDDPIDFERSRLLATLSRPEVAADLVDSPDRMTGAPADWATLLEKQVWLTDGQVDRFAGPGPLITDDRPRSEYFLWRQLTTADTSWIGEDSLRAATPR